MTFIARIGQSISNVVDLEHATLLKQETIAGSGLNRESYEYELSFFDTDGDGRADVMRSIGGQTTDSYGRALPKPTGICLSTFDRQGRVVGHASARNGATVSHVESYEHATGRFRSESAGTLSGTVGTRSEGDFELSDAPSKSGIGLAEQEATNPLGLHCQAIIRWVAYGSDDDGNGVIAPSEVHAPGVRIPNFDPVRDRDEAERVRHRLSSGFDGSW